MLKNLKSSQHFDTIDDYDSEIPLHIAHYLNGIKTEKTYLAICNRYHPNNQKTTNTMHGIDLGSGTGEHILSLEKRDGSLVIDGLDISAKQIRNAKNKGMNNHFLHSSMHDIPCEDASYQFAYAINSIHHIESVEQQKQAFQEVFRILQPGGHFIIHEINIKNPIFKFYFNHIFPRTRGIDNGSEIWLSEQLVKESPFTIVNVDYFTFIPDFTPQFMFSAAQKFDAFLSNSRFSKFGAHIMYHLQK